MSKKTIIDGLGGVSHSPKEKTLPGQAGLPARSSDALDVPRDQQDAETPTGTGWDRKGDVAAKRPPPSPPARPDAEKVGPDASSATDVIDLIESTRETNPTNENFMVDELHHRK